MKVLSETDAVPTITGVMAAGIVFGLAPSTHILSFWSCFIYKSLLKLKGLRE